MKILLKKIIEYIPGTIILCALLFGTYIYWTAPDDRYNKKEENTQVYSIDPSSQEAKEERMREEIQDLEQLRAEEEHYNELLKKRHEEELEWEREQQRLADLEEEEMRKYYKAIERGEEPPKYSTESEITPGFYWDY